MRRGALAILAIVLLCAAAPSARAEETEARVEARIVPERGIVVGARAALEVKISTTAIRFAGSPTVPEPRIPHAIVRRLDQSTLKGTERADGKDWIYQTWTFDLWPARAGLYDVAPLAIVVRVPGEGRDTTVLRANTQPLTFEVRRPERGEDSHYALAARAFAIEESLDRPLDDLRVGDAVVRTLTMRVKDAPGMLIPPREADEIPGLGIYADTPQVRDEFARGDLTGIRVETTTYVMEKAGTYEFPAVRIPWWNLVPGALEEAVVEGHEIVVAPNPELASEEGAGRADEAALDDEGRRRGASLRTLAWALAAIVAALLLARFVRRRLPRMRARLSERREARESSESAYFHRFEEACGTNQAAATNTALRRWLDRAFGPAYTLEAYVASANDDEVTREVERLQQALYGRAAGQPWTGSALANAVACTRRAQRYAGDGLEVLRLNPSASSSPAEGRS